MASKESSLQNNGKDKRLAKFALLLVTKKVAFQHWNLGVRRSSCSLRRSISENHIDNWKLKHPLKILRNPAAGSILAWINFIQLFFVTNRGIKTFECYCPESYHRLTSKARATYQKWSPCDMLLLGAVSGACLIKLITSVVYGFS